MINESDKHDYERLAIAIGQDETLVQGAGGNISIKSGLRMIIKASGARLSDPIDNSKVALVSIETDVAMNNTGVEPYKSTKSRFTGRPSIETALHSFLPQRVVCHTHSYGALARTVAFREPPELPPLAEALWVGYQRPGLRLANEMRIGLKSNTNVVFLQNHGLVVAADSVDEVIDLQTQIESVLRRIHHREAPKIEVRPDQTLVGVCDVAWLNDLSRGILWPDEAVILGDSPFDPETGLVRWDAQGKLESCRPMSADELSMVRACLTVGSFVPRIADLSYLTTEEVNDLLNWEAEKYRIQKVRS